MQVCSEGDEVAWARDWWKRVAVEPGNVVAIRSRTTPETITELCSFLELACTIPIYLRGWHNFCALHSQTSGKKSDTVVPNSESRNAFQKLEDAFVSPPIFAFLFFYLPFIVETEARSGAVRALLTQKREDGHIHAIAYSTGLWAALRSDIARLVKRHSLSSLPSRR